jgi:hypothetical protein
MAGTPSLLVFAGSKNFCRLLQKSGLHGATKLRRQFIEGGLGSQYELTRPAYLKPKIKSCFGCSSPAICVKAATIARLPSLGSAALRFLT